MQTYQEIYEDLQRINKNCRKIHGSLRDKCRDNKRRKKIYDRNQESIDEMFYRIAGVGLDIIANYSSFIREEKQDISVLLDLARKTTNDIRSYLLFKQISQRH